MSMSLLLTCSVFIRNGTKETIAAKKLGEILKSREEAEYCSAGEVATREDCRKGAGTCPM